MSPTNTTPVAIVWAPCPTERGGTLVCAWQGAWGFAVPDDGPHRLSALADLAEWWPRDGARVPTGEQGPPALALVWDELPPGLLPLDVQIVSVASRVPPTLWTLAEAAAWAGVPAGEPVTDAYALLAIWDRIERGLP